MWGVDKNLNPMRIRRKIEIINGDRNENLKSYPNWTIAIPNKRMGLSL